MTMRETVAERNTIMRATRLRNRRALHTVTVSLALVAFGAFLVGRAGAAPNPKPNPRHVPTTTTTKPGRVSLLPGENMQLIPPVSVRKLPHTL